MGGIWQEESSLMSHDAIMIFSGNCTLMTPFMICVSEEVWILDPGRLNDLVLYHLLVIGAWDWDQKDGGELHQAT